MTFILEGLLQQPEGKTLEFKRDLSSPKPILKTLVAFANTAGGRLIIGITDDHQLIGVDDPLTEEERLCNLIADAISPRLVPNVEMVTIEDKTLLVIEVYLSNSRPHWLKANGPELGVYVRLGSTNRQADRELIAELQRSVEGIAFDEMPMPELSVDDLDLNAAQALFGNDRHLDNQSLFTLRLLTHYQGREVPTKGAVLLFGKQRSAHFADAWIQCGRFLGTEKIDIFDHIDIHAPLPTAVDEIMLFLKKHAFRGADLSEVRRKDVWSIPLGILREAVINALVHADYSQRGAPIRIVFLDDRIEIDNPGLFLPGLTLEDIKQGTSKIRNTVIARVFRELHLIEQWGTGVRRIFAEAKELGLPEPQLIETGMRVRFIIPLLEPITLSRNIKPVGEQIESRPESRPESRHESQLESQLNSALAAKVLLKLKDQDAGKSALARHLGHKSVSGELKKQIKRLLDLDLIEMTLPDKPNSRLQKYRLTENGRSLLLSLHLDDRTQGN